MTTDIILFFSLGYCILLSRVNDQSIIMVLQNCRKYQKNKQRRSSDFMFQGGKNILIHVEIAFRQNNRQQKVYVLICCREKVYTDVIIVVVREYLCMHMLYIKTDKLKKKTKGLLIWIFSKTVFRSCCCQWSKLRPRY